MEPALFLKGIIIGFIMAIPVGPIGLICIRKTLASGRSKGFPVGAGAATADMIYSGVAALGVTMVSEILLHQKIWIRLTGAAVIVFLGVRTYFAKPLVSIQNIQNESALKSYISTVLLTLTNPFTIFAFIAVFAALGLGRDLSTAQIILLSSGVFFGSGFWFFTLSTGVTLFRDKISPSGLGLINKVTGVLILLSAVVSVASLL